MTECWYLTLFFLFLFLFFFFFFFFWGGGGCGCARVVLWWNGLYGLHGVPCARARVRSTPSNGIRQSITNVCGSMFETHTAIG